MSSKAKKVLLKFGVSALLFGVIFAKVDKKILLETLKMVDLRYAPLIVLFLVLNYVVSSIRWKKLLIHENTSHITVKYLTGLYFMGSFFNNFMPTSIGGDVFKVVKLGKKMGSTTDAFSATFMERFTGVIALVLISSASMIHLLGFLGLIIFVGFWVAVAVGFSSLKLVSKKVKFVNKIYDSLLEYKGHKKVIVIAFITSFAVQLLTIFTQYFIFVSLGVRPPLFYSLFIFPVIILASFFIPSLNGVGVQDSLYIKLFVVVGVAEPLALSASVLFHLFRLGVSLVGGVLYAVDRNQV